MEKYSELYYVHNIWGGLEIKIPDLLMIGFNIIVLSICFILLGMLLLFNMLKKPTIDLIQVGPLCHLCT